MAHGSFGDIAGWARGARFLCAISQVSPSRSASSASVSFLGKGGMMDSDETNRSQETNQAIERVSALEFSKINRKLQYENPDFWTDQRIAEAEETYRRFLVLNVLYPQQVLAVNRLLDEYWHNHILDTRKYASDCDAVFGSLLHHYPYFGLPGEQDEGQNVPALAVTERLWADTFGAPLVKDAVVPDAPRLTLDRVLAGVQRGDGGPDAGPSGCKNGQHCQKVIAPIELEQDAPIVAIAQPEL
jgi:hypothetical protein